MWHLTRRLVGPQWGSIVLCPFKMEMNALPNITPDMNVSRLSINAVVLGISRQFCSIWIKSYSFSDIWVLNAYYYIILWSEIYLSNWGIIKVSSSFIKTIFVNNLHRFQRFLPFYPDYKGTVSANFHWHWYQKHSTVLARI